MLFGFLDPQWGYALLVAIIVGVLTSINGVSWKTGCGISVGPVGMTIVAFLATLGLNSLVIWWTHPVFGGPWPANGYGGLFFLDSILIVIYLAISSGVGAWSANDENRYTSGNDYWGFWISLAVLGIYLLSAGIPFAAGSTTDGYPGFACNYVNEKGNFYGTTKYGALRVKFDNTMYPPTKPEDMVKVAEATAHLEADRVIGQMGNVSSYAQISDGAGYLEKDPSGHPWWVESLTVKDMTNFNSNGAAIPGFILVDALNPKVPPQIVTGHHIQYVPGLSSPADAGKDPNTYVYYNYLKGTDMKVDGLTENSNIEVQWDSQGNPQPRFTGILLKPYKGSDLWQPAGVLIFNPDMNNPSVDNGGIKIIQISDLAKPEYSWLNHAYSEDDMDNAVAAFGQAGPYIKQLGIGHDWCVNTGASGQVQADQKTYVMTTQGIVRQYDLTSTQADNSAKALLYVDPNTLQATIYPFQSAVSSAVQKMMEKAALSQLRQTVSATQCQIQVLLGTNVWYCILVSTGQGAGNDGSHIGYGFVTAANSVSANDSTVNVDTTFDGAYNDLKTQIANGGGTPTTTGVSTSSSTTTVTGTVDRTGQIAKSSGTSYCYIWLTDAKYQTVTFRVSSDNEQNIATCVRLRHGDNISMVVQTVLYGNNFTDVKSIQINKEAPSTSYTGLLKVA